MYHRASKTWPLIGLLAGAVAISALCGITAHHAANISNISTSCCETEYPPVALLQPLQEKGFVFALFSLLAFFVAYSIQKFKQVVGREDARAPSLPQPYEVSPNIFVELFRRGILNPKIYNLALIRN